MGVMQVTVGRNAPNVCIHWDPDGFSQSSETRSNGRCAARVDCMWHHACMHVESNSSSCCRETLGIVAVKDPSVVDIYRLQCCGTMAWRCEDEEGTSGQSSLHSLHFHVQRRHGNGTNGVTHETLDLTFAIQ